MTTTVGLLSPLLPPTAVTPAVAEEHQQQDYYYVPQPQPTHVVRMKMWNDDVDEDNSYCTEDNSTNSFLLLNNMGIVTSMSHETGSESSACKRRLSSTLDDHIPKIARRMVNNEDLLQNELIVEQLDTASRLDDEVATSSIVAAIAAVTEDSDCSIEDDDEDDDDDDDDDDDEDDDNDQYLPAGSLSPLSTMSSSNSGSVTNSSNSSSLSTLSSSQSHHTPNHWSQNHQQQQTIKCDTNGKCYLDLGSGGSCITTIQQRTSSEPECCELGLCVPATQCYRRRRAAVFDASMRKLGKSSGGSGNGSSQQSCEAGLRRSVLICNTLRLIEREMSREAAQAAQAQQRRCCTSITTSTPQHHQRIDVLQQHSQNNNGNRRSPTPYPTEYRNGRTEMVVEHNSSSNSSSSSSSSSSTTDSIDSGVDDEYYYDEDDDMKEHHHSHIPGMTSNPELNNHHLHYYQLNGSVEECDNYINSDDYDEEDDEEDEEEDSSNSPLMDHEIYDSNYNNKRHTELAIGGSQCDNNTLPLLGNSNTTVTSIDWGSVLSLSSSNSTNSQSTSSTSITLMNNVEDRHDLSNSNMDRKTQQHKRRKRHHKNHYYHHNQIYNKHRHHHSHHHQRSQKRRERGTSVSKTKTSTNY